MITRTDIYFYSFLIASIVALFFANANMRVVIALALAMVILLKRLYEGKKFIQRGAAGEISLRKKMGGPLVMALVLLLLYSFYYFNITHNRFSFALLVTTWAVALGELVLYFWFRKNNPAIITILGNEMIQNDRNYMRKDIRDLEEVKLDISGTRVLFCFSDKSVIRIRENDHPYTEIKQFIHRALEKAGKPVAIERDLEHRLNSY